MGVAGQEERAVQGMHWPSSWCRQPLEHRQCLGGPRGPALRAVLVCSQETFTKGRSTSSRSRWTCLSRIASRTVAFTEEVSECPWRRREALASAEQQQGYAALDRAAMDRAGGNGPQHLTAWSDGTGVFSCWCTHPPNCHGHRFDCHWMATMTVN